MNMTKHAEYDGGIEKPIQYAVKVTVRVVDSGYLGTASWRFLDGSCAVDLEIRDGQFLATNFIVLHKTSRSLQKAMQERGLNGEEKEYLEKLFRETIES